MAVSSPSSDLVHSPHRNENPADEGKTEPYPESVPRCMIDLQFSSDTIEDFKHMVELTKHMHHIDGSDLRYPEDNQLNALEMFKWRLENTRLYRQDGTGACPAEAYLPPGHLCDIIDIIDLL